MQWAIERFEWDEIMKHISQMSLSCVKSYSERPSEPATLLGRPGRQARPWFLAHEGGSEILKCRFLHSTNRTFVANSFHNEVYYFVCSKGPTDSSQAENCNETLLFKTACLLSQMYKRIQCCILPVTAV
jgi:hypothetical protein